MSGIAVEVVIDAPISFVWNDLQPAASQVGWMANAIDLRFPESATAFTGMGFECDSAIGPLTGTGVFELTASGSATILSRIERLAVPWYLGGPAGAIIARPMLRSRWRRNLRQLKQQIESAWAQERRTNA